MIDKKNNKALHYRINDNVLRNKRCMNISTKEQTLKVCKFTGNKTCTFISIKEQTLYVYYYKDTNTAYILI